MSRIGNSLARIGVRAPADFIGALLALIFALIVLGQLRELTARAGERIGAATVPSLFLGLVVIMALIVLALSFRRDGEPFELPHLRGTLFIVGAIVIFAVAVRPLGLLAAGFLSTFAAAFATDEVRPVEALVIAVILSSLCCLLFVTALGLNLPIWPKGI